MVLTFVWPSRKNPAGGVVVMYEFANALARRGHDVHFIHGPSGPHRVSRVDEIERFDFHNAVDHHIVDTLDQPNLPAGDVVLTSVLYTRLPAKLGLPCVFIQGYGAFGSKIEDPAFRIQAPKACVSHWLTDVGQDLGVPPEQLWHVPPGLDHGLFNAGDQVLDRTIDVATLRNTHFAKGWDIARAALIELRSRRRNLRATVFSATPRAEPLPPRTRFLCFPSQRQLVDEVYRNTHVFLQASRQEGLGLTAVEAMSCGAALVTTDAGGSRDYAFDDKTALVVDSEDVMGLVDAVETLLDDDDQRARLAAAGREHILGFDWDRSAAILEVHLERYLANPDHYRRPPASA